MLRRRRTLFVVSEPSGAGKTTLCREARLCLPDIAPSMDELAQRLRERRSDAESEIARRLARAREEVTLWRSYDYLVVNRDLKEAADHLTSIITAERCRTARLALDIPDLEESS